MLLKGDFNFKAHHARISIFSFCLGQKLYMYRSFKLAGNGVFDDIDVLDISKYFTDFLDHAERMCNRKVHYFELRIKA